MRRYDLEILKSYDSQFKKKSPHDFFRGPLTWSRLFSLVVKGGWKYYLWLSLLITSILIGIPVYVAQCQKGLIITGMRDPFSWGLYIANFTFLVGMAAAAVIIIIPAYLYNYQPLKNLCIISEVLAASSIIMSLLFILVDLGRPDRFWHILPGLGQLNFPQSLMAWDVVVLNGYLFLSLIIPIYLLYCKYHYQAPKTWFFTPLVYLSIIWAISIHTVTALIYGCLSSVSSWHQAILIPRFLASAFVVGPAFLILALQIIRHYTLLNVEDKAIHKLAEIASIALFFNLFMLGAEIFLEYYTHTSHFDHRLYLLFGLDGLNAYVKPTWISMTLQVSALMLLIWPKFRHNFKILNFSCLSVFTGIWLEKGLILMVSGFVPSPVGEIFEYRPTLPEIAITIAVWAIGLLIFTIGLKITIPIDAGVFRSKVIIEHPEKTPQEIEIPDQTPKSVS